MEQNILKRNKWKCKNLVRETNSEVYMELQFLFSLILSRGALHILYLLHLVLLMCCKRMVFFCIDIMMGKATVAFDQLSNIYVKKPWCIEYRLFTKYTLQYRASRDFIPLPRRVFGTNKIKQFLNNVLQYIKDGLVYVFTNISGDCAKN